MSAATTKIPLRLLIIDDSAEDRELYRRWVGAWPEPICSVREVESADEGLEYLRSAPVDCILLDYDLPDRNGLECLALLAEDKNLDVPVVMLTGLGSEPVAVEAMKRGAQDYLVKGRIDGETLRRAIHHATERHQMIRALEEARRHQHFFATHDSLTHLYNRHEFYAQLSASLALARRHEHMMAVFFIDFTDFKAINDSAGHPIGDAFLKVAAERLKACMRESDLAARLGGDEFALLLRNLSSASDVRVVAEKSLRSLAEPVVVEGHCLATTASIGVAFFPDDGENAEVLLAKADRAMYSAKERSPGTYLCYNDELEVKQLRDRNVERRLREALGGQLLELHYQPQVCLERRSVIGVEALARWDDRELGVVRPDEFIRVAEQSRLIAPLGEWVLETACQQHHRWARIGRTDLKMAVNLSACQLSQGDLPRLVEELLARASMAPEQLELEITESAVMRDVEHSIHTLRFLKRLGVRISIDDFGTGHSSLGYLQRLPADSLKIDRSFVHAVTTDASMRSIIAAIIALAHSLDLETIAEGVETHEQMSYLRSQGCHKMQGYLFGRPVPAEAVREGFAPTLPTEGDLEPCEVS